MNLTVCHKDEKKALSAQAGESLLASLRRNGYVLSAPCGGRGVCGKCRVKLLSGSVRGDMPDAEGFVSACRAFPTGDCEILLPETGESALTDFFGAAVPAFRLSGAGAALDVGTTTLALALIDLESGLELCALSALNPQSAYGADVISRISACESGALTELNLLILGKTRELLDAAMARSGVSEISHLTVAGNPTMLHLFCGENPSGIGRAPFTPVFLDRREYTGAQLSLPVGRVTILPSAAAYIGSDITAGILASELEQKSALLIDIGTNGEMVLSHGGRLFCASTAAGPALEGAGIECGMGGVAGAIDHARLCGGRSEYTVIGGGRARGLCGSGLTDVMALMLELGAMDETGAMEKERFDICEGVYVSRSDVRAYQLAKSAICSGARTLLRKAGISAPSEALLAGGLGYYTSPESAIKTGLLPAGLSGKLSAIGNSALRGAELALYPEMLERLDGIARRCEVIDLTRSAYFAEQYIENMLFE